MAQIISFPLKTPTPETRPAETRPAEAATSAAQRRMETAAAEFDRMMAHHAELQRQTAAFSRLCEQAAAEPASAEVLYYPAGRGDERLFA